ncbi:MAG TPA: prepilin-type N-terminal cleavage/methylation domain-containing protein [Planctomycetota bacterium]|nr:prepilin-type N-terminal cleavage/methylation domain-containing protein [Planctomycetota bacterium]
MLNPRPKNRKSGFSLIELVIAMAILAILVGVVSMRSGNLLDRSKVTKITQAIDSIKTAAVLFHTDTGRYAYHTTGNARQLVVPTYTGWDGPYIDDPDLGRNNPFGVMYLDNNHDGFGRVTGWDLDGDGTEELTGNCNVVLLTGIDADMAAKLDAHYDNNMAGKGGATWNKVGRFQYVSGNQSGIIFLYQ